MENIEINKKTARKVKRCSKKGVSASRCTDSHEKELWKLDHFVCGIDEVGRGCLAGPVVAAAAILNRKRSLLVRDSKLLNAQQLVDGYEWIIKNGWYGIGIVDNRHIDQHNIYQATLQAMNKALLNLLATCPHQPMRILIDAMPLSLAHSTYNHIPIHSFTQGERHSSSIAAASIVAKVTRDRIMNHLSNVFPGYDFDKHKGYGTKKHQEAIVTHGKSILHRETFLHGTTNSESDEGNQQTIC